MVDWLGKDGHKQIIYWKNLIRCNYWYYDVFANKLNCAMQTEQSWKCYFGAMKGWNQLEVIFCDACFKALNF